MKLKATLSRMLRMCPAAWRIWMASVRLTALVLLGAFVLLLGWGGSMWFGSRLYWTAMALYETGQSLLLVGALLSVCIEDVYTSRR